MKCDACGHVNVPRVHLLKAEKTWCGKGMFGQCTGRKAEATCKACLRFEKMYIKRCNNGRV